MTSKRLLTVEASALLRAADCIEEHGHAKGSYFTGEPERTKEEVVAALRHAAMS